MYLHFGISYSKMNEAQSWCLTCYAHSINISLEIRKYFCIQSLVCVITSQMLSQIWGYSAISNILVQSFLFQFDLLAVQGTPKSLLQHHSSKVSILWPSAFFMVQLSHPYMTTGETKAMTRRTFVSKVTSLLFNMLSRLVIAFLPRNKLVSHWFHCFPMYLP